MFALKREQETYKGWTVLGQVDLDSFVDSHVATAQEFEENFKAVKIRRREAEKLPEIIKVVRTTPWCKKQDRMLSMIAKISCPTRRGSFQSSMVVGVFSLSTGGLHHREHVSVQGLHRGPAAAPGRCPHGFPQERGALELQGCRCVPGRLDGKSQQAAPHHRRHRRGDGMPGIAFACRCLLFSCSLTVEYLAHSPG